MEKWGRGDTQTPSRNVGGPGGREDNPGEQENHHKMSWTIQSIPSQDSDPLCHPWGQPRPGTFTKPALPPAKLSSCQSPVPGLGQTQPKDFQHQNLGCGSSGSLLGVCCAINVSLSYKRDKVLGAGTTICHSTASLSQGSLPEQIYSDSSNCRLLQHFKYFLSTSSCL